MRGQDPFHETPRCRSQAIDRPQASAPVALMRHNAGGPPTSAWLHHRDAPLEDAGMFVVRDFDTEHAAEQWQPLGERPIIRDVQAQPIQNRPPSTSDGKPRRDAITLRQGRSEVRRSSLSARAIETVVVAVTKIIGKRSDQAPICRSRLSEDARRHFPPARASSNARLRTSVSLSRPIRDAADDTDGCG